MGFGQLFFDINHFFDQLIFDTVKLSLLIDQMFPVRISTSLLGIQMDL